MIYSPGPDIQFVRHIARLITLLKDKDLHTRFVMARTASHFLPALFALLLTSIGVPAAVAQVDPVYTPRSNAGPTQQSINLSRDVFVQLTLVSDEAVTAENLTQLLRRAGQVCAGVTDFQVVVRRGSEQRVKMKCPGRRHYGMTITQGGSVQVYGGDGMVGDFIPGDGIIHAVAGTVRPDPATINLPKPSSENGNLPGLLQGSDPNKIPTWLVFLVVINGFIILALILSFFWFMRAKTQGPRPVKPKETGMTSAEKDRLIIDSREILPDIYHHPEGFFIARGKRGKRRLFGNLFFAIIYRDYGFKFREIS